MLSRMANSINSSFMLSCSFISVTWGTIIMSLPANNEPSSAKSLVRAQKLKSILSALWALSTACDLFISVGLLARHHLCSCLKLCHMQVHENNSATSDMIPQRRHFSHLNQSHLLIWMCTLRCCSSSLVLFVLQVPDLSGLYLDVTCFWWPYSADSVMFSLSIPPVNKVLRPELLRRDIILMRSSSQVEAKHALRVCWCISCFVCRALGAQNIATDGVTHPTQQLSQRLIIIGTRVFFSFVIGIDGIMEIN